MQFFITLLHFLTSLRPRNRLFRNFIMRNYQIRICINSPRISFNPTPKYNICSQISYLGVGYRRLLRTWSARSCRGIDWICGEYPYF